jgi:hypothetical protein
MTHDGLVNNLYSDKIDLINEHISKSKFPLTFKILQNFNAKFFALNQSLELLNKIDTFYVSQGLTRIMIEHFIVSFFIWTKCRTENTDNCANNYHYYYMIFEKFKQTNYNSKLDGTYDKSKTALQNLMPKYPLTNGKIDEAGIQEVNSKSNEFDIRRILKYLNEDLNEFDFYKDYKYLVHSACISYNNLSSYVHAGRDAEFQAFEKLTVEEKKEKIESNINFSRLFLREIKSWIFLLMILEDRSLLSIYQPVIDYLRNKIPD